MSAHANGDGPAAAPTAYVNARLRRPRVGSRHAGRAAERERADRRLRPGLFADGVPDGIDVVDCGGHCLAPGLIDMRVHLREPGQEHMEDIASATAAAAAGGVTTMVCLPNTDPPIDDVSLIEFVARRARETGKVKIYPYGAITRACAGEELTEMGILAEAGALAFTDGTRAVSSALVMRRALSYAKTFGLLIVQHPEEASLSADGAMNEGEISTRLGLPSIPAEAEVMVVERDLRLVELTGGRYHVAHVSTAATVEAIRRAKARGLGVTCDTAPQYFTLNEGAVGDYRTFAKVSPPLRSEDDRLAVREGVRDGTIDAIASDHAPQDQDSKRLPFVQAENGIVGLETLLALSLALHHAGDAALLDVLAKLTHRPADILGLNEGRLRQGAPCDLVLFDVARPWRVEPDAFRSKSKNSPFEGHPVQGQVLRTVVGRRTAFERAA